MKPLLKLITPSVLNRNYPHLNGSVRCLFLNRDWKPGPYPKTQAEREAAAKRYGLHIKDYQPFPEDGFGMGDYPMFDIVSEDAKDANEYYDNPGARRNYGELIHRDYPDYWDHRMSSKQHPIPLWKRTCVFLGSVTLFVGLFLFFDQFKVEKRVMDPQLYSENKKHYTFELVD